ncbi:MAG: hypothetical protein JW820_09815 [Spirochaetales bacterium]|nr:hypothetical protein [Spirochaetales bacterium]
MSRLFIDTPHLVFQIHDTQADSALDFPAGDLRVLRELGRRYAEIASLPIQEESRRRWQRLNDLEPERPLIWTNEVCWNEMDHDGSLLLRCSNEVCQRIELEMRRTLYQWEHFRGDMIVEPVFYSPLIIENTGFGINPVADVAVTDETSEIASRHFYNQIQGEEDLEKIQPPRIRYDRGRTDEFLAAYRRVFDGILPVEKRGSPGFWFAPWDDIVFWMGAEQVLMGLAVQPELMHKIIRRLTDVYLEGLAQFERLNLLALNTCNVRIGSGAYGYTKQLPQGGFDPARVRPIDIWGSATPQIFGSVSPQMHEEFGVAYELEWLSRFGLTYYGCCEPLHDKLDVLEKIPNLRKISISPWADVPAAARRIGRRYVISLKPSPSVLAAPSWHPDQVRHELETKLAAARGCNVEIVLKDLSTVQRQPHRLWQWMEVASEVAARYG